MTGQVISFRFGDQQLETLRTIQQPGESLSQTAQRFLKQSLGISTPPATATMSTLLAEVDKRIVEQLAPIHEKLNQLEAAFGGVRSLSVDKIDTPRQQENSQFIEQLRSDNEALVHKNQELQQELGNAAATPEPPDYKAVRDRVLKSLTGRGRIATTSPQYKTAVKALDKFIEELNKEKSASPENWESRAEMFLEETNWHE
jgi:hypothetical protein